MSKPLDVSQLIFETNLEMERLDWNPQKAKEFLIETYGKKSCNLLSEEELLDFLRYLKYLPTPESQLNNRIKNPIKNLVVSKNQNSIDKNGNKTTRSTTRRNKNTQPIDLSDVIANTDVEMERLGWTPQQGREYLINTYGKRGRTLLTEEELLDFLQHLESIPTPELELSEVDPFAGF